MKIGKYSLGIDLGSSSVKVSVLNIDTGKSEGSSSFPKIEMEIMSPEKAWAEQHPKIWWENTCLAIREVMQKSNVSGKDIAAIGIAYQMHGLVIVDKDLEPLRPSIIWCDSRAVEIGERLLEKVGKAKSLASLLNSPGNFTLSKLLWVKENEPKVFEKIYKFMLPGDFIAMKLSDEVQTTPSGLSEGIMWDFLNNEPAGFLFDEAGIGTDLIPSITSNFGIQSRLCVRVASELGLASGIPISYRAGDQPNNAFALGLLNPGEAAANAGTSGVVYGVSEKVNYDPLSRVNTFAHVNHNSGQTRLGVLLCINGTGIANSWFRKLSGASTFETMNEEAGQIPPGSDKLLFLPFGNGAERMLGNRFTGARLLNLDFTAHTNGTIFRAVQEGIACAFKYGMDIMHETGVDVNVIRAGQANLFLSEVFAQSLSGLTGAEIHLFDTDGSLGAARGAALGAGLYSSEEDCFSELKKIRSFTPSPQTTSMYKDLYGEWKEALDKTINS